MKHQISNQKNRTVVHSLIWKHLQPILLKENAWYSYILYLRIFHKNFLKYPHNNPVNYVLVFIWEEEAKEFFSFLFILFFFLM